MSNRVKMDLRVSTYDRVQSFLSALLVIIGFFVVMMFILWLTTVLIFGRSDIEVEYIEEIAGRGEHAKGYERDLEEPGEEEMEELIEPQLAAALEAVTDVLSSQEAKLDALATDSQVTGKGKGRGDSRQAGPGGEGDNIIPRWERWQIKFSTTSINLYAKQLDSFGIELGAAGGGSPNIDYVSNLSKSPKTRKGTGDLEKRLYMSWKTGVLKQFDRQLIQKAGIRTNSRVLLQFYPRNVENMLAKLERDNAKGRKVTEFKRRFSAFAAKAVGTSSS